MSEETIGHYFDYLRPLARAWAEVPVRQWSRLHLDAYIAAHPEWSPRSVRAFVTACRRLIRWGQDAGLAVPDFVGRFRPPAPTPREATPLSIEEVRRVLAAARDGPLDLAVHLALLAGLRLRDLHELAWEEIDLEGGWIVRRPSKTARRQRAHPRIPIVAQLAEALRRHRAATGPVCRTLLGDGWMSDEIHALYARARVQRPRNGSYHGWHRLRHTYATLLAAQRVDVATLARLLAHGHGSRSTLVYLHADDERLLAAARALERTLG